MTRPVHELLKEALDALRELDDNLSDARADACRLYDKIDWIDDDITSARGLLEDALRAAGLVDGDGDVIPPPDDEDEDDEDDVGTCASCMLDGIPLNNLDARGRCPDCRQAEPCPDCGDWFDPEFRDADSNCCNRCAEKRREASTAAGPEMPEPELHEPFAKG